MDVDITCPWKPWWWFSGMQEY